MTQSELAPPARIGVIGLGALGLPMAINLRKAGYRMQVHTRSRRAEADPSLQGARRCDSPASTAIDVETLLICVSDGAAVEDVIFGAKGAARWLASGATVVDLSTIAPATSITMAERLAQQGVTYL
ncbi:MAG TPA: NAD(P)-binding domain-containing protein, partial [Prochlorococcus sp.]